MLNVPDAVRRNLCKNYKVVIARMKGQEIIVCRFMRDHYSQEYDR